MAAEANYDVGKRELLSIKAALEEWQHWLQRTRHPFLMLMDHHNLEYLRGAKCLNPRQACWALFFTRFQFSVTYHPGTKTGKADAVQATSPSLHPEPILTPSIILAPIWWNLVEEIQQAHAKDPPPPTCPPSKLYVPTSLCPHVMQWVHEIPGTVQLLQNKFWCPSLVHNVGCELEEKERFWSELDEVMESIPTGERVVIGADFSGYVGEGNTGDEEVMGKFGVKERKLEGQTVVDFAKRMDMAVVNTYFQKREEHRVTYKSGAHSLGGQVVLPDDWESTAEVIRDTGRKVLGVSSGRRKEDKETWWWNEEVQDSIQRKTLAKKKWDMDRTKENRQEYKELQRRVKREVSKAKQKAYDELYTRLDTREGEKDLYRLARQRDRDGKDVQQVRVIKDRDGRVLTSEESVQRRWKEYFEELMNEENEREKRVEGVNSVEQKVDKIRKDEVRKDLKRMKSGKAVGPDNIPVEYRDGQRELHCVFVNLAKAYDRVPREELWYCMRKSGVAEKYVRVVQDMYERSRTVVRCAVGQTEEFKVEVGLHQGLALSPFLFAMVMDQLSEEVRQV
ncbi:hypothetical protein QTP70_034498 [Hemibagrus guttatus]|uniref:Reverse transcriptase domain-containing protein n=1 Tax=Hemibagrus guttatus TaxID=175788 RepID=A0AAE0V943_9TELE|nr:hypothetical protein QTP70_034498 [Hemibagrus guttatus]